VELELFSEESISKPTEEIEVMAVNIYVEDDEILYDRS
jgi:hypothetical protein